MEKPVCAAIIEASSGEITSRGALLGRAEELARNIREGELVPLQLPNSAEFVALMLAIFRRRAIAVLIDRDAPEAEVKTIIDQFDVGRPARRPAMPPDARLLKLTSGSSGTPKAIVTTEANLLADAQNICRTMDIRPEDVSFGAIPLSHSYGYSNLVTPLLMQGTTLVISNDYLPASILEYCNRYRCTILPGIPMMFDHLASSDRASGRFTTVRTCISAGAPLAGPTSRRFRERFGLPIHSFYGCSECGAIAYDRRGGSVERGVIGPPADGVTVSLRRGRVVVRSAAVGLGILSDASTYEPFRHGEFMTDDLAEFRSDELALTGRAGDLINIAGKKVNPREVELVILRIAGVRDVKVYGEAAGARGEVVAAAVVAAPDVTREQIRVHCREQLASHKVPRIVKLIEQIPVDERGKIRRSALAEL